jgi:hypothetical protein
MTGFARVKPHQPAGQDLAEFGQALGGGHVVGVEWRHRHQSRYGFRMRSI